VADRDIRGADRVREVFARVGNGDLSVADLSADDGVIVYGDGARAEGRDAIRAFYARAIEGVRPQPFLNLLHRLGHPRKTKWNVHIRERYRHGAGVVTYLARYLRGGPLKNARLVAYDGDRVTFTCRARPEEADGDRPSAQRLILAVTDLLQRLLLHVPAPQTRIVRSYGLYHHTQSAALVVCRGELGQPPVEPPGPLDWQTVCARQGDTHPERCPICGQLLVCTEVIPRAGAPPPVPWRERAA